MKTASTTKSYESFLFNSFSFFVFVLSVLSSAWLLPSLSADISPGAEYRSPKPRPSRGLTQRPWKGAPAPVRRRLEKQRAEGEIRRKGGGKGEERERKGGARGARVFHNWIGLAERFQTERNLRKRCL